MRHRRIDLTLEPRGISTTELNSFGRCIPAVMSCHGWDTVLVFLFSTNAIEDENQDQKT